MNVTSVERKENNQMKLVVEVENEKFEAAVNTVYRRNRGSIYVPGFRKGKAPRKIIEGMYGTSIFYEEAIDLLYPEAYEFAVEQEKLNVVGRPAIEEVNVSDDKALTIVFSVALYPEVTMGEYKGLTAPKQAAEVTDEDIQAEVESLRKRNGRIVSAERAAIDGDTAVIDFEGFLDGVPFDGGKSEGYSLVLGSGQFVPGFEEQVVGMEPGQEKDITVTFPEDYTPELAGKDVIFKVKLLEVKETILPEADDEFAKDVSEFDTLEEYKNSLRENLLKEREQSAQQEWENKLAEIAVENMQADIPDAMVEERQDSILEDYSRQLSGSGMNLENYVQMMGMTMDMFRGSVRSAALSQVKMDLAAAKIAELENMEISEDELNAEYDKMAESYGMEAEKIKAAVPSDMLIKDLSMKKAMQLVVDTGIVGEPAKEESAEEAKSEKKKAAPKKVALKKQENAEKAEQDAEAEQETPKKTTRKTAKKTDEEAEAE